MLDLVVVAPHPSFLLPSALARRASSPRQRRVLPPLLVIAALGSVAFVLWQRKRRRQASDSIDRGARRAQLAAPTQPAAPAQPAARVVHPVRLGQLRELARELAQRGREAEAGLLDNYALLLERTGVSRERVLAEVTRMLQAAEDERNVPAPAQRVWRRVPLPAARTPAVSGEPGRAARRRAAR